MGTSADSDSPELPFFRPSIGAAERVNIDRALDSGWLTSGPMVREFEERFAELAGAAYAVALNSATAALHLSLVAYDIGAGDEVIVPTMTFAAGAEVVHAVGATPVFVDVLPETLAIDPDAVEAALTDKTRAIMPMHYGGLACNLNRIKELAVGAGNDVVVLDDAAHAFPATLDGEPVGGLTDGSSFSFYANKTITTGEGGMFTTNNAEAANRVRRLSLHGLSRDAWNRFETRARWDYDIVEPGWKYNLTDVAAGIGLAQLDKAHEFANARRAVAEIYDNTFAELANATLVSAGSRQASACHLYVLRIDRSSTPNGRDGVIDALQDARIGSSVHYRPIHMHSYYRDRGYQASDYPVAASAFDEIVSLPLFPGMTSAEVDRVIETVTQAIE